MSAQTTIKMVDHNKRVKGWFIFYISFAAAQIILSFYSMFVRGVYQIWWIILPYVVLAVLAVCLKYYQNKVWAVIFGLYYLLLHSTMIVLENLAGSGGVLSLVSWVGIVGVFQCWISISKLKHSKTIT